jgi:ABC-type sugar transport system permease subunit
MDKRSSNFGCLLRLVSTKRRLINRQRRHSAKRILGLFNYPLSWLHLPAINWLGDPHWSKLAIVLVAQFGAGHIALIFLAALRAIPSTLYDAPFVGRR